MMKLIFPENGSIDDAMIEHDFSGLRQNADFMAASDKFESYLEANAEALHLPQNVLADICHLAANAATAAMHFAYEEGLQDGIQLASGIQQDPDDTPADTASHPTALERRELYKTKLPQ